jgi:TrmH family RNA methyltransferase
MTRNSDLTNRPLRGAVPRSHGGDDLIRGRDNQWLKRFRAALRGAPGSHSIEGGMEIFADRSGEKASVEIGVEGPHLVGEALRAAATGGLLVEAILVDTHGNRHLGIFAEVPEQLKARDHQPARDDSRNTASFSPRILRTTDELFRSIAGTETPQGIAALVRLRERSLYELFNAETESKAALRPLGREANPLLVVLVGVQDPGNVGTAVRSAEAFGASGLIATKGTANPWSQKALRASSGSALRFPIVRGMPVEDVLDQIRLRCQTGDILRAPGDVPPSSAGKARHQAGTLRIYATCVHPPKGRAVMTPEETDWRGPVALLIGNEAVGLDESILRAADSLIRISLAAPVESLNAGVAASLLLYEAARQRGDE